MSFDEAEFLEGLRDYIDGACSSPVNCYIVKEILPHPDNSMYQLKPPFYAFKDGAAINVNMDECLIDYTLEVHAYVDVRDELSGPIIGRAPVATWPGVCDLITTLEGIITYENMVGISLTHVAVLSANWARIGPSVNHMLLAGRNWQSKMLTYQFQLRNIS